MGGVCHKVDRRRPAPGPGTLLPFPSLSVVLCGRSLGDLTQWRKEFSPVRKVSSFGPRGHTAGFLN